MKIFQIICFKVPYMIYQTYSSTERISTDIRSPYMQLISYDKAGIPILGKPAGIEVKFPEPYNVD